MVVEGVGGWRKPQPAKIVTRTVPLATLWMNNLLS